MGEQRYRLPPDPRPPGTPPTQAAHLLLFELQRRGHVVTVEASPPRLRIVPGAPEFLPALVERAYEIRDLLSQERAS